MSKWFLTLSSPRLAVFVLVAIVTTSLCACRKSNGGAAAEEGGQTPDLPQGAAGIVLSATELPFSAAAGAAGSITLEITTPGKTASFAASTNRDWLRVSPSSGTTPAVVTVTASAAAWTHATFQKAALTVTSLGLEPQVAEAHFAVSGPCPSVMALTQDGTVADLGSNGSLHGITLPTGSTLTLGLDCENEMSPCGLCAVTGLLPNSDLDASRSYNRRCTSDSRVKCSSDAQCGIGVCRIYLAPITAFLTGGEPIALCARVHFVDEPTGTINFETGEVAIDPVTLTADNSSSRHCDACPSDDCGGPCQVDGHTPWGDVSLDCKNEGGGAPSTTFTTGPIVSSDTTWTISEASPPFRFQGGGAMGISALCATCAADRRVVCRTDLDCAGVGGACSTVDTSRPGQLADECIAVDGASARWSRNTRPVCSGNAALDCRADYPVDLACPGAGTCSAEAPMPCHLGVSDGILGASLTAPGGSPSPYGPQAGSLFCHEVISANRYGGTPGPSRIRLSWQPLPLGPTPAPTPPVEATFTLAVTLDGTGTGRIVSAPSGIDCGNAPVATDCEAQLPAFTSAAFTATAASDSVLVALGQDCDESAGHVPCTVTFDRRALVWAVDSVALARADNALTAAVDSLEIRTNEMVPPDGSARTQAEGLTWSSDQDWLRAEWVEPSTSTPRDNGDWKVINIKARADWATPALAPSPEDQPYVGHLTLSSANGFSAAVLTVTFRVIDGS